MPSPIAPALTKVADRYGKPLVVFHGTLSKFETLTPEHSADNNDFGRGIYFTSSEEDARVNYATEGAEAQRKRDRGLPIESTGQVLRANLNLKNPIIIGGKNETRFLVADGSFDRAVQAMHTAVYANEAQDPAGPGRGVRGGADYMRDKGFKRAPSYTKGYVGARDFVALVRGQMGLDTGNWGDPKAINKKMEYLRQAFVTMGFDGIIDRSAGVRFAWRAKNSDVGNVAHLDKNVVHYVAFHSEQVKVLGVVKDSATEDQKALSRAIPAPQVEAPATPAVSHQARPAHDL